MYCSKIINNAISDQTTTAMPLMSCTPMAGYRDTPIHMFPYPLYYNEPVFVKFWFKDINYMSRQMKGLSPSDLLNYKAQKKRAFSLKIKTNMPYK